MNNHGSLCPTIKASEILGDKWTLLLLRELFFGSTRYNQFQRALPRISPTVLSNRLKTMEQHGLVVHRKAAGQRGEYVMTPSARELAPIVDSLARWGLRWARDQLCDLDLDAGGFMWDFHRTLKLDALPDGRTVISVIFPDVDGAGQWWLVIQAGTVDLCNEDPGYDVEAYITGKLSTLAAVWMGEATLADETAQGNVSLTGARHLVNSAGRWFPKSIYAEDLATIRSRPASDT